MDLGQVRPNDLINQRANFKIDGVVLLRSMSWRRQSCFWLRLGAKTVVFLTQVIGTDARLTLRRDLRTLVYSAFTRSHLAA
jgi:hypothetical protein